MKRSITRPYRREILLGIIPLILSSSCTAPVTASDLEVLRAIDCSEEEPTSVHHDFSWSGRDDEIIADRLAVERSVVTTAAVCDTPILITAFADTVGNAQVLLDSDDIPPIAGATEIARLRRVPRAVDEAMKKLEARLASTLEGLPGKGSDILGQLDLAREFTDMQEDTSSLTVIVLTDGIANRDVVLKRPDLDEEMALRLADQVAVPRLEDAHIIFAGIGQTSGSAPSTAHVAAMKTFWAAICERTGADQCDIMTGYPAGVSV